jgi:hypothetical protein
VALSLHPNRSDHQRHQRRNLHASLATDQSLGRFPRSKNGQLRSEDAVAAMEKTLLRKWSSNRRASRNENLFNVPEANYQQTSPLLFYRVFSSPS